MKKKNTKNNIFKQNYEFEQNLKNVICSLARPF